MYQLDHFIWNVFSEVSNHGSNYNSEGTVNPNELSIVYYIPNRFTNHVTKPYINVNQLGNNLFSDIKKYKL